MSELPEWKHEEVYALGRREERDEGRLFRRKLHQHVHHQRKNNEDKDTFGKRQQEKQKSRNLCPRITKKKEERTTHEGKRERERERVTEIEKEKFK